MTPPSSRGRHAQSSTGVLGASPVLRRRTLVVAVAAVVTIMGLITYAESGTKASSAPTSTCQDCTTTTASPSTTVPLNRRAPDAIPVVAKRLSLFTTIGGPISPKSVVATNTGLVFAENMMYRHSVTVYTSSGTLKTTISDAVNLTHYGVPGRPGVTHGAPVEAAVTPDGKYVWVSNYSMYGVGSGPEGSDTCTPGSARAAGDTNSFLYRINLKSLSIDGIAPAGIVSKFLTVTPNGHYLLASNWCSWDLSVVDLTNNHLIASIPMGAYPRGIAVSPDSRYAYVAIMGSSVLNVVDLSTLKSVGTIPVGLNVRHVVIDPVNGRYLYASLNASGVVVKVDRLTHQIVARVHTGSGCRTLAISTDGTALFVVNYDSNTMTMLRAADLAILQNVATGTHPVGVTYDGVTGRVWVAVYTGEIMVFNTKKP